MADDNLNEETVSNPEEQISSGFIRFYKNNPAVLNASTG